MNGWFDIKEFPITREQSDAPRGLRDAVDEIHALINSIRAKGIHWRRIILGGFSQGGALAIYAGLSFNKRLGGIATFGAWGLRKDKYESLVEGRNIRTPILMCHGEEDTTCDVTLAEEFADLLKSHEFQVDFHKFPEVKPLEEFIGTILPETEDSEPVLAPKDFMNMGP